MIKFVNYKKHPLLGLISMPCDICKKEFIAKDGLVINDPNIDFEVSHFCSDKCFKRFKKCEILK